MAETREKLVPSHEVAGVESYLPILAIDSVKRQRQVFHVLSICYWSTGHRRLNKRSPGKNKEHNIRKRIIMA